MPYNRIRIFAHKGVVGVLKGFSVRYRMLAVISLMSLGLVFVSL